MKIKKKAITNIANEIDNILKFTIASNIIIDIPTIISLRTFNIFNTNPCEKFDTKFVIL